MAGVPKVVVDLLNSLIKDAPPGMWHATRNAADNVPIGPGNPFPTDKEAFNLLDLLFPPGANPLAPNGQPVEQLYQPAARDTLAAKAKAKAETWNPETWDDTDTLIKGMMAEPQPTGPASYGSDPKVYPEDVVRAQEEGVQRAEEVLAYLKAGKAAELTDRDFRLHDPLAETFFNEHLFKNYDLPMDAESRAARAAASDWSDERWFRGSEGNSAAPRTNRLFTASDPKVAETYTGSQHSYERSGGYQARGIAPLRFRNTPEDLHFSPRMQDTRWQSLRPSDSAVTRRNGEVINDLGRDVGDYGVSTDEVVSWNSARHPEASTTFEGIEDLGGKSVEGAGASNIRATQDGTKIRSAFARFDPRLSHLKNLNAGVGGAALTYGLASSAGDAEAAVPPENDVQAKLLASIDNFVRNMPKRGGLSEEDIAAMQAQYGDLQPANTTGRDTIRSSVLDSLTGLGVPDATATRLAGAVAGSEMDPNVGMGGMGFADLLPFIGTGMGVEEGKNAYDRGDMIGAGAAAVGTALSALPVVGALGSKAVRAGAKAFGKATEGNMALPDLLAGIGHNGAPVSGIDTVDLPPGSNPRYRGAAPDRAEASFPRYTPKNVPERMQRLVAAADDPENPINAMFDGYIEKGKTLNGSDWYNTEELRDWFTSELGEKEGDARWREFIDLVGATSTGSAVPDNLRNASFYNALTPIDRANVAELVAQGGITPAAAARQLGIEVPNMPPVKGPGSYNYGHVMQGNHASNVLNQIDGKWMRIPPEGLKGAELTKWLQANPKVKGFANSMLGDTKNIAADKHFMRMLAMADGSPDFLSAQAGGSVEMLDTLRATYGDAIEPYITNRMAKGKPVVQVNLAKAAKDGVITDTTALKSMPTAWEDTPSATEYAALEEMAQRLAKKYDMTPAQFQANLWMGAGEITGLADESQGTAMELIRRMLDKRAGERGLTRKEMLQDFIVNRAPLALGPLGAIGLLNGPDEKKGGT